LESKGSHIAAQVDQRLAEAATAHPWLIAATDGMRIDPTGLDATEIFDGIVTLMGALIDSVNLLADAIDRHHDE
jgi:hypothetical protein